MLEDCDEDGVIVIPLVKVAGFKVVFRQHFDPSEIRRIPKEELSRFSHQVPSHLLTGQEGSNLLKGCLELDPSAIPSQFLQLMSEIETMELEETDEVTETVKAVKCDGLTSTELGKTIEVETDEVIETVKAVECDGLTSTKLGKTIELVEEIDEDTETVKQLNVMV
ncbi:hypothetical protein OROHE_014317 [Orobanche hederae]